LVWLVTAPGSELRGRARADGLDSPAHRAAHPGRVARAQAACLQQGARGDPVVSSRARAGSRPVARPARAAARSWAGAAARTRVAARPSAGEVAATRLRLAAALSSADAAAATRVAARPRADAAVAARAEPPLVRPWSPVRPLVVCMARSRILILAAAPSVQGQTPALSRMRRRTRAWLCRARIPCAGPARCL